MKKRNASPRICSSWIPLPPSCKENGKIFIFFPLLVHGKEMFGYLYHCTLVEWQEGNRHHAFGHFRKFKQNIREKGKWHVLKTTGAGWTLRGYEEQRAGPKKNIDLPSTRGDPRERKEGQIQNRRRNKVKRKEKKDPSPHGLCGGPLRKRSFFSLLQNLLSMHNLNLYAPSHYHKFSFLKLAFKQNLSPPFITT